MHRPRYDDWSLPKGKLHPGELALAAAVREVTEETGVRPVVGRRLPTQRYELGPDRKYVDYWAMTPADGDIRRHRRGRLAALGHAGARRRRR